MKHTSKNLYDFFYGDWLFTREILNFGKAEGGVIFTPNPSVITSLIYNETGCFYDLSGHAFKIHREYIYDFSEEKINIYHAHHQQYGRFFLELIFLTQDSNASGKHLCINDHYSAQLKLLSPSEFQLHFKVEGPKKDYLIQTYFKRA